MVRSLHAILLLAVLLVSDACSRGRRRPGPIVEPVVVIFSNRALEQATVYAIARGANPQRIGTVQSGRTDTLTIRPGLVAPGESVDFVARLLARSRTPRSGPVSVRPGDVLSVTLTSDANVLSVVPARDQ